MTVAQYFHDKPFAMLNWHRNWCETQRCKPFCFLHDCVAAASTVHVKDIKRTWQNCPHREICFLAFINSDATAEKGAR